MSMTIAEAEAIIAAPLDDLYRDLGEKVLKSQNFAGAPNKAFVKRSAAEAVSRFLYEHLCPLIKTNPSVRSHIQAFKGLKSAKEFIVIAAMIYPDRMMDVSYIGTALAIIVAESLESQCFEG